MRVYLDNASTTPIHPEVIGTMLEVLTVDFGNPSSIHQHGRKARSIIEQSRKIVAKSIHASIGEVFFTSSATEANNMVLKNAIRDLGISRIISSPTEHHCILHTLDHISSSTDCICPLLQVDAFGQIDYDELEKLLQDTSRKTLVSIMHGNNEIGTMADINKIGQLCKKYGALFHCDTVQTMGKYPINVQTSQIHFLSGSAHKFHGPKGIGFVYINNEHMLHPYIHGGAQERNMRAGTENIAGIAGLAKALEISTQNMGESYLKVLALRNSFKTMLTDLIEDVSFNGMQDEEWTMAHVLSVSFPPSNRADMLLMNLDIAGISASSGSACSAGIEEDSHVLLAIGHPEERKTIRFSFSPYNTMGEIDFTIQKLKEIAKEKV